MLATRVQAPVLKDPPITVRVLVPIFVKGIECAVGSSVVINTSDGQALCASVPPRVEII
jgi:hypothetical protein